MAFSDEQLQTAIEDLTDPERFREAEQRVMRAAPQLQGVLNRALAEGGFFEAHESQLRQSLGDESAVRTLLAEETRMGMMIGVAVGWELARVLSAGPGDVAGSADPDPGAT